MRRLNSDGIDRAELLIALKSEATIKKAKDRNQCLLCRTGPVNDAGICRECYANLTEGELIAARPWVEGRAP